MMNPRPHAELHPRSLIGPGAPDSYLFCTRPPLPTLFHSRRRQGIVRQNAPGPRINAAARQAIYPACPPGSPSPKHFLETHSTDSLSTRGVSQNPEMMRLPGYTWIMQTLDAYSVFRSAVYRAATLFSWSRKQSHPDDHYIESKIRILATTEEVNQVFPR